MSETNDMEARLAALREELLTHINAKVERPVCVPPDRACKLWGFSRPVFDRWLADPREGLEDSPKPVVFRPNGPGGKVMVHVARMQDWLDARGRPKRRA